MTKFLLFSSSTCGPCRMMKPAWERVVEKYKKDPETEFMSFVVDQDDSAMPYVKKFKIRSVPTLVACDENYDKLESYTGVLSQEWLEEFILRNIEYEPEL